MKRLAWPAAALALAPLSVPSDADACGGVFRKITTRTVPSLQVEQVLLVHDPVKEEEHFIRQLVFHDAKEPFGFLVPTPSKPTVAKVEGSPFKALVERYPPEAPPLRLGRGGGPGSGGGLGSIGAGASGASSVQVLSQERIGHFTAFTLAATDSAALEGWLKSNDFTTTPESAAWLAHYVALGFFYTAFRYEPNAKAPGAELESETVRISFATPVPYYPYSEPKHPAGTPALPRVLAVWLVAPQRSIPVASRGGQLLKPWREDIKYEPATPEELSPLLGKAAAFLPKAKDLTVQTFEDQKTEREGWGDVLLVPETPLDGARRERVLKLGAALEGGK